MAAWLRATFRSIRLAWLVLAVSLTMVAVLWAWVRQDVRQHTRRVAERRAAQLALEIRNQLGGYRALVGEAAMAVQVHPDSSGEALDSLLQVLVERGDIPGYSGLGVCRLQRGAEGAERCVTLAVAGPKEGPRHFLGLDHFSIPERAEAMLRARDSGRAALTAPLRLMVDSPQGSPGSVILYQPIYAGARPPDTPEARRASILGYVFCSIPMAEFAQGIWYLQDRDTAVEIRDTATGMAVFRSGGWDSGSAPDPAVQATAGLEAGGRSWHISLRPLDAFASRRDVRSPGHVLILGLLVSLLSFAVAFSLEGARSRAEQLARGLAGEARENEARLREIAETMGEGLYVVDREGCITFANAEAGRLLGFEPTELLGRDAHDLFHRQSADGRQVSPEACGILRVAREGGRYVSEEEVYWHREHRPLAVAVSASPVLQAGTPGGAVVVFRDISARRQAEADLEQRNAWVRAMLDTPSFRIWIKDREGRYMAVNAPFARNCGGREPEVLLGLTDFDLLPREQAEAYAAVDREVMATRLPKTLEQPTDGPGGRRWTETVKTPILGRDGEVYGVAGLSRDITDRKQVEWALGHAQKLESLELMAGGIAHDFNNLFQGLLGNLELAQMGVAEDSQAGACLRRMGEILARAARLSGEMLLYSGRSHLRRAALDLASLARQAAADGRAEVDLDGHLPPLEGDPAQIGKLLSILLENAAEAGGGAPVRLSLRLAELAPADLAEGYWPEPGRCGPMVRIEVADGGPGIPPEVLPRMFDPFYSTKAMGRGLGLSAALGILRGHKGQIQVVSQPGGGTRVRVYFPARETAAPGMAGAAPLRSAKGTLLFVDDDAEVRRPVAELIRSRLGYEVVEASGGEEAVALFLAQPDRIALILIDATMPGLDGPAAFEAIRRIRPDARAILCSGYGDAEGRAAVAEHGFAAFLRKPFGFKDLEALLAKHLEGR